ncbi:ATP-binding protein [Chryseobacterium indoltheticum]|uniref:ATP-dependent zinc metalloprotease FtsH n=1 Tax=Chryseobacterium indoltheticum TaxID=254 RepID=A0A381F4C1_9FLAO|nr:ATP-binding protein [Chryseobacterium indoltheticum]SIQ61131.1 ATPase family associated with various cellular activities (AAA) [Chryseobacterium indoltheticum]SUX41405.1 ATP-dependent zinc metalloprotease FtsH [Chryseobacterium indoltheticum]
MEQEQIQKLFTHLEEVIKWRINNASEDFNTAAPELKTNDHEGFQLGNYISGKKLKHQEVIILLMALLPRLDPSLLKRIFLEFPSSVLFDYCVTNDNGRLFYPTIQTVQYILGGESISERLKALDYFDPNSVLIKEELIVLSGSSEHSSTNSQISVHQETFNTIVFGVEVLPKMSNDFPAELLQTRRSWDDLILPKITLNEIKSIEDWYNSSRILMEDWDMQKKLKPGFRVLFYGEPGTGKTLAASLLGKYTKRPVFRVDVSMLVSKYIGETEKHLAKLFDKAENKNWILFFDEADAIFGKRTNVRDAHDKYANQEVSYLLQRIETFSGLIILASNFKNNMDKAFTRRFHSCIKFNNPKYEERLRIWQQNLPAQLQLKDINLEQIAKRYELTGSNIMNVIQDVSLKTIASQEPDYRVSLEVFLESIKKEYVKEDKIFT